MERDENLILVTEDGTTWTDIAVATGFAEEVIRGYAPNLPLGENDELPEGSIIELPDVEPGEEPFTHLINPTTYRVEEGERPFADELPLISISIDRYDAATGSYLLTDENGQQYRLTIDQVAWLVGHSDRSVEDAVRVLGFGLNEVVAAQNISLQTPFLPNASTNRLLEVRFLHQPNPRQSFRDHLISEVLHFYNLYGGLFEGEAAPSESFLRSLSDEELADFAGLVAYSAQESIENAIVDNEGLHLNYRLEEGQSFDQDLHLVRCGDDWCIARLDGTIVRPLTEDERAAFPDVEDPLMMTSNIVGGVFNQDGELITIAPNSVEYHPLKNAEALRASDLLKLAFDYSAAAELDADLNSIQDWDAEAERQLLARLSLLIERMPDTVLGVIPAGFVREAFRSFHIIMLANYRQKLEIRARAEAFEQAMREEYGQIPLGLQLGSFIPFVGDILDPAFAIWDTLHGRFNLADWIGILPVIPGGARFVDDLLDYTIWGRRFVTFNNRLGSMARLGLRNEYAHLTMLQTWRTSRLAQQYGINIHIAGRTADTLYEFDVRRSALHDALRLAEQNGLLSDDLRADLLDLPNAAVALRTALERLTYDQQVEWAVIQKRVANAYTDSGWIISPAQVKLSTGGSEVDFFVDPNEWGALSKEARDSIQDELMEIYGVDETDAYQEIKLASFNADGTLNLEKDIAPQFWAGWGDRWPPSNPPPGSIMFSKGGMIIHNQLGRLISLPFLPFSISIPPNVWRSAIDDILFQSR